MLRHKIKYSLAVGYVLFCLLSTVFAAPLPSLAHQNLAHQNLVFEKIVLDKYDSAYENTALFQDSLGYLWIGSTGALFRYDGFQSVAFSVPDNAMVNAISALHGDIIVGTTQGLYRVNNNKQALELIKVKSTDNMVVVSMVQANDGSLWLGTRAGIKVMTSLNQFYSLEMPQGSSTIDAVAVFKNVILAATRTGLYAFDQQTKQIISIKQLFPKLQDYNFADEAFFTLYITKKQKIWLGTQHSGAYVFDKSSSHAKHLTVKNSALASNYVWGITEDDQGNIWLSSRTNGVSILPQGNAPAVNFSHSAKLKHSLVDNEVVALLKDKQGNIWLGSTTGVSIYHHWQNSLYHFRPAGAADKLANLKINQILLDPKRQGYWLAASQGLYFVNKNTATVKQITTQEKKTTLVNQIILDQKGSLWIGSDNGLFLMKTDSFIATEKKTNNKSINDVVNFRLQTNGELWAFTWVDGAYVFNKEQQFSFQLSRKQGLPSERLIDAIVLDDKIVVGSWHGISLFDKTLKLLATYSYKSAPKSVHSMANFTLLNNHQLRFDAEQGSMIFDLNSHRFTQYGKKKPSINSEPYGLSIPMSAHKFKLDRHFGVAPMSAFQKSADNILIASEFGIAKVNYQAIPQGLLPPPKLYNEQGQLLAASITLDYSTPLTIKINNFLFAPENQTQFQYKLIQFEQNWHTLETGNTLNIGLFPDGEHQLKVRVKSGAYAWSNAKTLQIYVIPPWWRSYYAYLIYSLLLLFIMYFIYRWRVNAISRFNQSLQQQVLAQTQQLSLEKSLVIEQANELRSINIEKTEFFETISHELRTPITLIMGPIKRLKNDIVDLQFKQSIELIERNANRLNTLVNQLLDLSRSGKSIVKNKQSTNLQQLLTQLIASFSANDNEHKIAFNLTYDANLFIAINHEEAEKLFSNLFTNAIKYSKNNVIINVLVSTEQNNVCIKVSDNGIGIKTADLPYIFQRFYRVTERDSKPVQGTGIGLSIVKAIIDSVKGKIEVQSQVNKGTSFTIYLPQGTSDNQSNELIEKLTESPSNKRTQHLKPTLLLVDDNSDMLIYLSSILLDEYTVVTENNGKSGIKNAIENIPDIIVSDVMMPVVDGLQLLTAIKSNELTNHIPVVLLTAKGSAAGKTKGLQLYADDYLAKPFDEQELSLKLRNLLKISETLKTKFIAQFKQVVLSNNTDKNSPYSSKFIKKLNNIIASNYQNSLFSVVELSREAALSERQLLRKLKAETNMGAKEYIRVYRLKKAVELLKIGKPASFTAIEVGFSSPAYFSSCFKTFYQLTPSQYVDDIRELSNDSQSNLMVDK